LLRAAIGIVALIEGGLYLSGRSDAESGSWLGVTIGLASGAALLLGLLTPVAGAVAGCWALVIGFALITAPLPNLFDARLSVALTAIMAVAVVFLGPGRYSLDARFFGRREIIIPPPHRRSEE
jgi:uncharacterized membrane protein YphA (DoxX/SURF4 family)